MTTTLFTPNGDGYDITAPGVLLLLADTARSTGPDEATKEGRIRAYDGIQEMLTAARVGGYAQAEVLETLLLIPPNGTPSVRVRDMAIEACAAAGDEAIARIFAAMRSKKAQP